MLAQECWSSSRRFESDLEGLINLRRVYQNNHLTGYLNTNSLREKIISLREILKKSKIDVLCNHPSIQKIKSVVNTGSEFDLAKPTASDINKVIKPLDTNKAIGSDGIPDKFVQMSANVIDCHLSNIITCDTSKNAYSDHAKTDTVRPIF